MFSRTPWLLLLVLALPQVAGGHAGAEWAALDVERPGLVEGSFGLLVEGGVDEGVPPWGWTCHEAITAPEALLTPSYAAGLDADGQEVVLAALPDPSQARDAGRTVYRTTDLCDWQAVPDLAEQPTAAVAFLAPAVAVAASTSTTTGEGGVSFHVSEDAGSSWRPAELDDEGAGRSLLGVTPDGAGGAWAVSYAGEEPDQVRVHRTADGLAWTTRPLGLAELDLELPEEGPLPARVLAAEGSRAWVGVADPSGHVVLATQDDGESWELVLRGTGVFVDGAIDDTGAVWMLESNRAVWRAADGLGFEVMDEAPLAEGIAATGEGGAVTLTTSELLTGALAFRLDATGEVTPSIRARDVRGPLDCPAGSDHTEVCDPLWFLVGVPQPVDPDDDEDVTDAMDEPGCQCGATPASAPVWLGLLALFARRRVR